METELRPAHDGNFGASIDPEPEQRQVDYHEDDSSPVFFQQQQQHPQYHMAPPPQHQQLQSQPSSSRGFFEDDDKMKYIIPIVAFIIGFFLSRTMNPIIIRSM